MSHEKNFIQRHREQGNRPTKTVDLPSQGYFYDEDDPLSNGEIELYEMTAKHEDILTDKSLAKTGKTIDRLIQSIVATPDVNFDTMLLGDKLGILVATRIIGYGAKYSFEYKLESKDERRQAVVDLTKDIDMKDVPFEEFDKHQKEFVYTLPSSGHQITFQLLRQKHEREMQQYKRKFQNQDPRIQASSNDANVTLRLQFMIEEIAFDGESTRSKSDIKYYVNEMLSARDSRALRDEIDRISPGMDTEVNVEDEEGYKTVPMSITPEFFFPSTMNT